VSACEKCWGDAFRRSMFDTSKTQSDHYQDLLEERKDKPCSSSEQAGTLSIEDIENCRENG